ncbi:MAG: hypothetical protein WBL85_06675 [Sedimentisphaerales bacterium]
MDTIGIQLKRYPYEEPYHLNLALSASNGLFAGQLEYFCNADDIKKIGTTLQSFPNKIPDEYLYEIGSAQKGNNSAYYFALHAYTTDMSGQCALQIVIDNNRDKPDEGACRFSIKAEPSAINRLGKLLLRFSEMKHQTLN